MTELVKLKSKGQLTLPSAVRRQMGLKEGDYIKIISTGGQATLVPQSLVDRELAISEEDIKQGRVYGPFSSVDAMLDSLHANAKKVKKSRATSSVK